MQKKFLGFIPPYVSAYNETIRRVETEAVVVIFNDVVVVNFHANKSNKTSLLCQLKNTYDAKNNEIIMETKRRVDIFLFVFCLLVASEIQSEHKPNMVLDMA